MENKKENDEKTVIKKLPAEVFPVRNDAAAGEPAACPGGQAIEQDVFYVHLKGRKCTFEEYKQAVRSLFMKAGYSAEETDRYFSEAGTAGLIREDFVHYKRGECNTPASTAYCLDMLYE